MTCSPKALGGDLQPGEQLVDVPAQAALHAGALAHHVLAVIHQQPEPAGLAVELGHREPGLSKRGPRHGQGVDRIGLAQLTAGPPGRGHEPGGDPTTRSPSLIRSASSRRVR